MNKEPIVEIKGLNTYIEDQHIHRNLDLVAYPRQILGIVGGSGSGKTVLMRAILQLQKSTGSIKIFGEDIAHKNNEALRHYQQRWGVMFQHGALFSSLTALENIAFPLQEFTELDAQFIHKIALLKIHMVGLEFSVGSKYPAELSGGMQKRIALARAIALDPELLFLDEPTAGLDPKAASSLDELVLNLRNNLALTVIMVTHDLDTLWRIADRVAFLGEGKVLAIGTMDDLYHSEHPAVRSYFKDPRARNARIRKEE